MSISNSDQNVVSEMAAAVAKMLDSDKKNLVSTNEELSDNEGFFMWIKDGAPGLHVQLNGAGKVPHVTGQNASASQEEMWNAYRRWQERKIIAHTLAPPMKRRPFLEFVGWAASSKTARTALMVIAGVVLLGATIGGVTSCVNEVNRVEAIRNAEVNKYGFRRGAIGSGYRFTYPESCSSVTYGNGRHFTSDYECRSTFEEWERRGEVWVDWKAQP